jgi:hypothetical protein
MDSSEAKLWQFVRFEIEASDFEKWIHSNAELEALCGTELHLALISCNYKNKLQTDEIRTQLRCWLERSDRRPSASDVEAKLAELASGVITPEEASIWASPYFQEEALDLEPFVSDAIESLAGADIPDIHRPYLFGPEDFAAWLSEFRLARNSRE